MANLIGFQKETLDLTNADPGAAEFMKRFPYCAAMAICAQNPVAVAAIVLGGFDKFVSESATLFEGHAFTPAEMREIFDHIKRHAKQHLRMVPTRGVRR